MSEKTTNPDPANRDYSPKELRAFADEAKEQDSNLAEVYERQAELVEFSGAVAVESAMGERPSDVIVDEENKTEAKGVMPLDGPVPDDELIGQFDISSFEDMSDLEDHEDYSKAKRQLENAQKRADEAAKKGDHTSEVFWKDQAVQAQNIVDTIRSTYGE